MSGTGRRNPARSATGADEVDAFIAALEHPHKDAVIALRGIILAADPRIGEGIKWNAPSFRTTGDFATMHLRQKQGIGLILHFGAKKPAIGAAGVDIADPHGLLEWLAKDRAIVVLRDRADVAAKSEALTALVHAWIAHLA